MYKCILTKSIKIRKSSRYFKRKEMPLYINDLLRSDLRTVWSVFFDKMHVRASVPAVKARSAVFTDNSGVSRILTVFFILMCDGLSVLLTLGISAISTTFVTLFLFLVVSNTVWVWFCYLIFEFYCCCFNFGWVNRGCCFATTLSPSFSYFEIYICVLLYQFTD